MPRLDLRIVTTHFEADMLAEIEALAEHEHVAKADVIRDLLRRGLKDKRAELELLERLAEPVA